MCHHYTGLHAKILVYVIQHDVCVWITWSPPWDLLDDSFIHLPPAPQPAETFGCQAECSDTEENLEDADATTSTPFLAFFFKT